MNQPFFTIAIPTYNRVEDLKVSLKFLLRQSFKDFEIVISDNCSTDNTKQVVKSFKDQRIRYFRNDNNIQVMPNVQRVIDLVRGKYIFLHADDDFITDKTTLKKVKEIIDKQKVGYVRLNYLSLSPDKKYIFDFRASKYYRHDAALKPNAKALKIIDFLLKSDCSFITGIVFKNDLPKNKKTIDSQLYPWFPIIFYAAKEYGAYYINKPYVIAGWSQWRVAEDNFNPLYSLVDGRLTSEKYFEFVRKKLSNSEYKEFLKKQLFGIYVTRFPAIKLFTGRKNMLRLKSRLLSIAPSLKRMPYFWIYLAISLIIPRFLLILMKRFYLFSYIRLLGQDKLTQEARKIKVD